MITRTVALLLLPAAAAAQTLSGGTFEMRTHGMGPVSQGNFAIAGGSITFSGGARAAFADYPLLEAAGKSVRPTPGGMMRYAAAYNNQIVEGGVRVSVMNLSVPEDFDFFINTNPAAFPMRVNPAVITAATARLSATLGPQTTLVPSTVVEFNLLPESGAFYDANLARTASITLPYPDGDGDGIVDGTTVRARTLGIYVLDESRALWVRMPLANVDATARTVTAPTPHFSVYALIGAADQVVDGVFAYPVPWAPNSGNPLDGTLQEGIMFTNLPSEGTISIYTLKGSLVRSLSIPAGLFPPQLRWDVRTTQGQNVVSGVYTWRVKSGKNSKLGKLMVIR